MNIDTGHLINMDSELAKKMFEKSFDNALKQGYEPVPNDLREAAARKLNGKEEAFVSKTSGGKLSKWAAKKRKAKHKTAKQARKRNR